MGPAAQIVVNNAALIRAVLAQGGAFALLPDFAIRDAVATGCLCMACDGRTVPEVAVHALYTERRTALTNNRAFVEFTVAALADI